MLVRSKIAAELALVLAVVLVVTPGPSAALASGPEAVPSQPARMPSVPGGEVPVRPPASDPASEAAKRPVSEPSTSDSRALTVTARGRQRVSVDYASLRHRYGGDWATRLRLVNADTGIAVPSTNDVAAGRLTATVDADPAGSRYTVAADEQGGTGDYAATSLSPAGTWQVSLSTGAFAWSYELRTPPAPNGRGPKLTLSYSSSGTDGRTASTNNQPSWVGEGWSMWPGFIERSYRSCADQPGAPRTGDLCWAGENATMSFDGRSSELVRDGTTARWRPRADDGTRVEQRFAPGNGDVRGEHWVVTTTDGVQYHFGSRGSAQSAWTVPVFGDSPGPGCGGVFATSFCQRAYRWNLDHVVDPHGNTVSYQYATETNQYARNLTDTAVSTYTRGGYLQRIDYGARTDETGAAPARVVFTVADRCRPGTNCAQHTGTAWPDVPFDRECTGTSCPGRYSPTFWSTKRLSTVTTQVLTGGAYRDVDRWTLDHLYPDPGDGTSAALWLHGITHAGLVGDSLALPPVTFGGVAMANRVNSAVDGLPPLNKYRITTIHNGSGGDVNVGYAPADCVREALPAPVTNTQRCFPVRWVPDGEVQPRDDWFHTYAVGQVTQDDRVAGGMLEVTAYEYLGGGAWHFDDNPLVPENRRTWSQWRGYEKVRVRHGNGSLEPGRPQSLTQYQYFRGMHADRGPSGTRTVSIVDSAGTAWVDEPPLAGFLREEITYNGVGGPVVSGTIHDPWTRGPTATQGSVSAFQVENVRSATRTALAAGGYRQTRVDTAYDDEGNPVVVNDLGDIATAADDRCTRTSYARNTGTWLLNLPSQVTTVGVACGATASYPADAVSDVRTYYDGQAFGAAAIAGDVTRTEEAAAYSGSGPSYVMTSEASHDAYGRVLDAYDPLRRKTTTRYAPATGLPGSITVTNPLGHAAVSTVESAWGEPLSTVDANSRRTDLTYDPLGRLTGVWQPGRSKELGQGPNLRFAYGIRDDGPSWVRTETLKPNGNYVTGYTLLDGFLRERQVQQPSPAGGRIITEKRYDSRGLLYLALGPYYHDTAPGPALFQPDINRVPTMTLTYFDGVKRPTDSIYLKLNQEQWRTSTVYGGDNVAVTPPAGATATRTYKDARDQVTEVRQYVGPRPDGGYEATRYRYTEAGDLAEVIDAAGNTWRYTYDARGRKIRAADPDHGESVMTYDQAGQLLTATDARGRTVATGYDGLGRRTTLRLGSPTGPLLAEWTYDTLSRGQLTSSTRYQNGEAYTRAVTGYDGAGRPQGETVTVPGRSLTMTRTYKADGSPSLERLPAIGDLPAETLTYGYNDLGQITSLKGATVYVNLATYTELGEPAQIELGNPANGPRVWRTNYYEDGTRRLSTVLTERERAGDLLVDRLSYAYDATGNTLSIVEEPIGDRQCFRYDHLRRMTEAWTQPGACASTPSAGGPVPYWHSYRYDVTGNRTSVVRHGLGGAADTVSTYAYPPGGQPQPHAVRTVQTTGAGPASFTYDAAGNTTGRPGQELAWDAEGNLESISAGGRTTSYRYDADGAQLVRHGPGSVTLLLGEAELTVDSATGAAKGTRFYRVNGGVVAVRTGAGVTWLAADHHGTNRLAVHPTTLQATTRRLDPFGNPRGSTPPTWPGADRGFVGGTTDDETGLTRLGAREYDPALGRFLSVDPVVDPNDPQQMNAYAYADNNPTSMSDPDGRYYLVDHEGLVRAPAARGQTPKAMQRVAKQLKRVKPMYDKWRKQLEAQRKARSRARQHDFDADGRRGRVGGGEKRANQFNEVVKILNEFTGLKGNNIYLASKLLDGVSAGVFTSFSICGDGEGGLLFGGGVTICTNFDAVGWTVSGGVAAGAEFGADADVSVKVRANSVAADKVDVGQIATLTLGAEFGLGPHGEIGVERSDPWNPSAQLSAFAEFGFGFGASLGSYRVPLDNFNSGYIRKW